MRVFRNGEEMFKQKKPVEQGLQIIIVGCGKVGQTLIAQLIKEGHAISRDASSSGLMIMARPRRSLK